MPITGDSDNQIARLTLGNAWTEGHPSASEIPRTPRRHGPHSLVAAQSKRAEARELLAPVYWFTEGFDTADLQGAKALREALTSSSNR